MYKDARERARCYDVADMVQHVFEIHCESMYDSRRVDAYEALLDAAGIPNLVHETRGYSQGDYVKAIFCLPESFYTVTGCENTPERNAANLEHSAKLFGLWVWGNVWFFTIEDSEGGHVESFGKFFGEWPHEDKEDFSGIQESIAEMIPDDWHVDSDIPAESLYGIV